MLPNGSECKQERLEKLASKSSREDWNAAATQIAQHLANPLHVVYQYLLGNRNTDVAIGQALTADGIHLIPGKTIISLSSLSRASSVSVGNRARRRLINSLKGIAILRIQRINNGVHITDIHKPQQIVSAIEWIVQQQTRPGQKPRSLVLFNFASQASKLSASLYDSAINVVSSDTIYGKWRLLSGGVHRQVGLTDNNHLGQQRTDHQQTQNQNEEQHDHRHHRILHDRLVDRLRRVNDNPLSIQEWFQVLKGKAST